MHYSNVHLYKQISKKTTNNYSNSDTSILHIFLALLTILWIATPVIASIPFFRAALLFGVYGFWLFLSLMINKNFLVHLLYRSKWLMVWVITLALWYLSGYHSRLDSIIIQFVYMFMIYSIYLFYSIKNDRVINKIIGWSLLWSFCLTAILTIREISINPLISKLISTGEYVGGASGVGGFSFIYAIAGLVPILILSLKCVNKINKIILLVIIIILIYTIFISSFATALFLMLGLTVLVFIPLNRWMLIGLTLIVLVVFISFRDNIGISLYYFSQSISNEFLQGRIVDISSVLIGESLGDDSSFGNRIKDFFISIETFIKNPVLGVGAYYGLDHLSKGIGGHSEWIDSLARYGIIGVMPLWLFLRDYYKQLKYKYKNNSHLKSINIFLVYIFLLGIFNPVFKNEINISMFLLIPFLSYIKKVEGEKNR